MTFPIIFDNENTTVTIVFTRENYIQYDVLSPKQEVCVRYIDVNRAVAAAKHKRSYVRPSGMNSLEPPLPSIDSSGELALAVTTILAAQFKLSPDEVLNGLPLMDMSRTPLWSECPAHVKPMPCTVERYRTFTGHCNNLKNPSWGAAFTPFVRYLPPVYANGKLEIICPQIILTNFLRNPNRNRCTSCLSCRRVSSSIPQTHYSSCSSRSRSTSRRIIHFAYELGSVY